MRYSILLLQAVRLILFLVTPNVPDGQTACSCNLVNLTAFTFSISAMTSEKYDKSTQS